MCSVCARAGFGGGGDRFGGGGLIDGLEEGENPELNNNYDKGDDSDSGLVGARVGALANGVTEVSAAEDLAGAVEKGGAVKLTADIDIDATLVVAGDATLDLNGHVLRMTNDGGSVFRVKSGGCLTIEDGNTENRSHKFNATNDLWVLDEQSGKKVVKGGIITGGTGARIDSSTYGGGVFIEPKGTLVMTGGSIVGCSAAADGGGVCVGNIYDAAGESSSFDMAGGSIIGCAADLGGGAYVAPMGKFDMDPGAEIRNCVARSGGGVYVTTTATKPPKGGSFMLNGGKILSCEAKGSSGSGRGGGVFNEGTFTMTSGAIEGCIASENQSEGVWNAGAFTKSGGVIDGNVTDGGTVLLTVGVSTEEEFLDALKNKDVATIRLLKEDFTVDEGDALTVDREITLINGSGNVGFSLYLHRPLTISKYGALVLEDNTIFYPFGNVTVEGGLTIGANCEVSFESGDSFFTISEGGTVTTVAAGEGEKPGLLSFCEGKPLAVKGTLVNNGILYVSDTANLKVAASAGGNLCLKNTTITEDCMLDMKGCVLTIEPSLKFDDSANLTVKNAKQVNATGVSLSGGSYYCPVIVGDNEGEITGGNFYDTVTFASQQGGQSIPVSGGTFYGDLEGNYSIQGHKVTFMNDDTKYAMQVTSGKTTAPDVPNKTGYTFVGWYTKDGKEFDFENARVTGGITLAAKWTINSSPRYQVIVPGEPSHGTVAVSAKYAYRGATVTVAVAPDAGYTLETLVAADARGNELTLTDKGDGVFTFVMPGSRVEVRASFMEDNSLLNLFYDVPNDAYFYEAVKWAVASGIAQGYGNGMFGPDDPCTRGQVVTFLWRAAGCPEPSAPSSFSDVSQDAYYVKAVAWAVEAGIAHGYSSDAFGPDDVCTRAQAATFLWRAAGSPESVASSGFADVAEGAYYVGAVAWAAENGITYGYDNGSFGPDDGCTRGQAVTFLWRVTL